MLLLCYSECSETFSIFELYKCLFIINIINTNSGADPGYVKRGAEIQKGGGRVADITQK